MVATAASVTVNPGDSIQAAVDAASPGDVIKVNPGEYTETHGNSAAVLITKRLKLIARNTKTETVVLKPGAGNTDGIVVEGAPGALIDGVLISGFTVEGFANNGIWLKYANKFRLKNNTSINNLENGIWPTLSANGLVKKNVAYGSVDSGLWVEASENIRVIKNEFYNNPTGLEVTVSKKVLMKGNNIHDNTVGVGLYHPDAAGLPPLGDDGDWTLIGNTVVNNNFPNPAPPGGLVASLPPGIGVLVIGVDRVTMLKNTVKDNTLAGIAIADWCLFNDCMPPPADDHPDDNTFIKNTVTGNGAGSIDPGFAAFESDIFMFTISGVNNCFSDNTYDFGFTVFPVPGALPEC